MVTSFLSDISLRAEISTVECQSRICFIVLMVSWSDLLLVNVWIGIFLICVMSVTKLAIQKAVSHPPMNACVSAASFD